MAHCGFSILSFDYSNLKKLNILHIGEVNLKSVFVVNFLLRGFESQKFQTILVEFTIRKLILDVFDLERRTRIFGNLCTEYVMNLD